MDREAAIIEAHEEFHFFCRYMFFKQRGYKWIKGDHHQIIVDALMRVYRGESKRLIINLPPRYSKTALCVIDFMAWTLGRHPDAEFIHTSYSARLATANSWQTRELVQHEAYREIFQNVEMRNDSTAKDEWRTTSGGCVYAVGAGGTITGYGAGKHRDGFGGAIIIDDPLKSDEAHSDAMREGANEWFQNTLESRRNSPDTPIILVMQRLHENDLSGFLLGGGNGEKWDHVCIPAINSDGTALWPEKHTIEDLRRMEQSASYVFSGQYMQRPSPLGGGIIKGAWFRRYVVAPVIKYRKIYADTAQKTAERNDYSVFQCWGFGDDGKAYLLDMVRGKWEAPELKRRAVDFWNKCKAEDQTRFGQLRQMAIEDKASGTGLIQDIKQSAMIPVYAIQRNKDKLTRVMDVVSYIESGYVVIPEGQAFVFDFVAECEAFTANDTHAHDDQVDPMCDAIQDMLIGSGSGADSLFAYMQKQYEERISA